MCHVLVFFSQSHSRDQNVAHVPVVPVGAVPGGALVVFRRRHLSVVHEVVRVQSQRSRQRPRLRVHRQLLQGEYYYIGIYLYLYFMFIYRRPVGIHKVE